MFSISGLHSALWITRGIPKISFLERLVNLSKKNGYKLILKPCINCTNDWSWLSRLQYSFSLWFWCELTKANSSQLCWNGSKVLNLEIFMITCHQQHFVIFLVFPEKPFIDMKEPWTKVWEVNVGDQSTQIPVRYSAYPDPGFKWYVHSTRRCSKRSTNSSLLYS